MPFYVGLPSPTIDWTAEDGVREIPIEERGTAEVTSISGRGEDGSLRNVQLTPDTSPAANYAFDITPRHLITGLITERGICDASADSLKRLFPEMG